MFLALLLFGGCSSTTVVQESPSPSIIPSPLTVPVEPLNFNTFLCKVNNLRKNALSEGTPLPDISPFTPDYSDELGTLTTEEIDLLLKPHGMQAGGLNQETATDDIDTFFQILQTAYGGYYYFGGDNVFLPMRDAVLADLQKETVILSRTLENLLIKHLSPVLVDGHFNIESHFVNEGRQQYMYYVQKSILRRLVAFTLNI